MPCLATFDMFIKNHELFIGWEVPIQFGDIKIVCRGLEE